MTSQHEAERTVICNLSASFEPVIDEVFNANYTEVVAAARARFRGTSPPARPDSR